MNHVLVQISVKVAFSHIVTVIAEVDKGSGGTTNVFGLVGPKQKVLYCRVEFLSYM